MTLHSFKKSATPSAYDFITNPVLFTAVASGNVVINASTYGAALNSSGPRLWDQTALPLFSSTALTTGQNVTIPFIASNLPTFLFDAIIILTVDGSTIIPYAFSTSPDNAVPTTTASDKILFWSELYCQGLNNNLGSTSTAANYMFGGIPIQGGASTNHKIHFSQAIPADFTYNWQVKYYSYTLGLNPYTASGTVTSLAGSTSSSFYIGTFSGLFFANSGLITYSTEGFYEVSITTSDPNYRSLLNYYHWGVA